jgi:hypothetical protein
MKNLLIENIHNRFGRKILFSSECEELSEHIYQSIEIKISAQTLRRILGFIKSDVKQSTRILNAISIYCGYKDYSDMLKDNKHNYKEENNTIYQLVKQFYRIENTNTDDYNYHLAAGNFVKFILNNQKITRNLQSFLSKHKVAQIYFFERYPYIDGISGSYRKLIKLYLQEKKDDTSQLFGNCLLHLGSILSLNYQESKNYLKKINSIGFSKETHPFLKGRYLMANLLQSYLNNDLSEQNKLTIRAFEIEKLEKRGKEPGVIFPYYQFIMADAFNLIDDHVSSNKMINICELDYNRIAIGKIASGYFEALDLIKAINLANLGKIEDSKRILKRVRPTDIIFTQHCYFLIQRFIAELHISRTNNRIKKKISDLILKTNFHFFSKKMA